MRVSNIRIARSGVTQKRERSRDVTQPGTVQVLLVAVTEGSRVSPLPVEPIELYSSDVSTFICWLDACRDGIALSL